MKNEMTDTVFSAIVVRCLKRASQDHISMAPPEIAHVLGKQVDEVLRIQNGEAAFTIEEVLKLGEACHRPISLLVQEEIRKKKTNIPADFKDVFKSLHNLLKIRARIAKSVAPEVSSRIPIKSVKQPHKKPRDLQPIPTNAQQTSGTPS